MSPGGTFTINNYGFQFDLSSSATALNGISVSATFATTVTATGASPSTRNTTITIPPYVISAGHATPSGTGSAGTFTADATGASEVTVSPGATGTLTLVLGAPVNLTEVAACTITNSAGTPITPPTIDTAPIALPAGSISAVLPNAGPPSGGTAVVIHGSYLGGASAVLLRWNPGHKLHPAHPRRHLRRRTRRDGGHGLRPRRDSRRRIDGDPGCRVHLHERTDRHRGEPIHRPTLGRVHRSPSPDRRFTGATAVDFGSAAATFTVNSATSITATSPAGTGVVDVTVHGPSGVSIISAQDRFNYRTGYWLVAGDGGVFSYGNKPFEGSAGALVLNKPIVGMAATPDNGGYWLVASDGGVFSYGDAQFFGSAGGMTLNEPIVGMAPTPDGFGYWLVAADGGVFSYGDAQFFGSTGGMRLNAPIVGMAATPDGRGYWLVAADGGVFNYGDATFYGSTGAQRLATPVAGIAATADGGGYWMVTKSGAVLNYGDAGFSGSAAGIRLTLPAVGIAAATGNGAYWLATGDGGVFTYGGAAFDGSAGGTHLNSPIVGISVA